MAVDRNRIAGLVLAGGKSTRMEGADKALLMFNGRPMVESVIERLRPQVDTLLINSRNAQLQSLGYPLVADAIGDQPGPLAGLHAGLRACSTPLLACVPCDAPLLPQDLVARLRAAFADDIDIAVVRTPRGLQPTFMLCRQPVGTSIEAFLASGRRALHEWLTMHRHVEVAFDDETAFSNVNTREELARLGQRAD